MIKISEIEQIFKDIFNDKETFVKSIDTVYESPVSSDEFLKLVISLHGLQIEDISVIHTKFIFKVDANKNHLKSNSFIYLYNTNCDYHRVNFDNILDFKKKLEDIIYSNDFGKDIQVLSDFIEAPAMFLNYYMRKNKITEYSIFDVKYEPKFKTAPCSNLTFDFEININNNYIIYVSVKKIEEDDTENKDSNYKFQFKFMDEIKTVKTSILDNIHFFIGSNISKMLDDKLKNK